MDYLLNGEGNEQGFELVDVLNLIINGLPSKRRVWYIGTYVTYKVLNLIINGLPSKHIWSN